MSVYVNHSKMCRTKEFKQRITGLGQCYAMKLKQMHLEQAVVYTQIYTDILLL